MLRYPDISQPYFQVYRVFLRVKKSNKGVSIVSYDKNVVHVEFECNRFDMKSRVIKSISKRAKKQALDFVNNLLDDENAI